MSLLALLEIFLCLSPRALKVTVTGQLFQRPLNGFWQPEPSLAFLLLLVQ